MKLLYNLHDEIAFSPHVEIFLELLDKENLGRCFTDYNAHVNNLSFLSAFRSLCFRWQLSDGYSFR